MKYVVLVLSIVFLGGTASAQSGQLQHSPTPLASGWTVVHRAPGTMCVGVACPTPDTVWVSGSSLLRSTNNGSSWEMISGDHGRPMAFLNGSKGFLTNYSVINRTTDAGLSWNPSATGATSLTDICFPTKDSGFAVGSQQICRTTNGGDSWQTLDLGSAQLEGVSFCDSKHGWAVGDEQYDQSHPKDPTAACFQTTDGGEHWNVVFVGVSRILYCVHTISVDTVLAGGDSGIIMTTNQGASWSYVYHNPLDIYQAFSFPSKSIGFAVSGYGKILRTMNGGANWIQQTNPTNARLLGASFVNDSQGYVVGDSGYILRTTTSGKASVTLPSGQGDYLQVQTFPQPASSSITLGYILPGASMVGISVYDVGGTLVATLMAGIHQEAGPHSVELNTATMPNGSYLYQIEASRTVAMGKFAVLHS